MKVLIACEFSGIVRDAFIKRGHDAVSCDLLPTERPGPHIQGDVLRALKANPNWDLMIAHPPCTYLCNAAARWLCPKGCLNQSRYRKGLAAKKFFVQLRQATIPQIAIENPTPSRIFKLPVPTQVIQPYQYGEPYTKRTLLWLKNLPMLQPTKVLSEYTAFCPSNTGLARSKTHKQQAGHAQSSRARSTTFQGIADAMAAQWG